MEPDLLKKCIELWKNDKNIIDFLKKNSTYDLSDIIEISYDLQSGSYIDFYNNNRSFYDDYTSEMSSFILDHIKEKSIILDIGTGEMTTFSVLLKKIFPKIKSSFCFDISLSRISKGIVFADSLLGPMSKINNPFVANMSEIPINSKGVDYVISSHALEPNGSNLEIILKELFRVCKKKLILFEPYYENNSSEGKLRMDKLGYVKDIENTVKKCGGEIIEISSLQNIANNLNPTACFVIKPSINKDKLSTNSFFTYPGTDYLLIKKKNYWLSSDLGVIFSEINEIPILKKDKAFLASSITGLVNG